MNLGKMDGFKVFFIKSICEVYLWILLCLCGRNLWIVD